MLKSPLAALFPRLFPRGSANEYPNSSNALRRRGTYVQGPFPPNQHHHFHRKTYLVRGEKVLRTFRILKIELACLYILGRTLTPVYP